jgi:hypothetical protein
LDRNCFIFLFSIFCLFKITTERISLWHFMHMWIITWLGSSILFFYLSPLLMVISSVLKILHSFFCRKYINHIHLPNFFLLLFLSC